MYLSSVYIVHTVGCTLLTHTHSLSLSLSLTHTHTHTVSMCVDTVSPSHLVTGTTLVQTRPFCVRSADSSSSATAVWCRSLTRDSLQSSSTESITTPPLSPKTTQAHHQRVFRPHPFPAERLGTVMVLVVVLSDLV